MLFIRRLGLANKVDSIPFLIELTWTSMECPFSTIEYLRLGEFCVL